MRTETHMVLWFSLRSETSCSSTVATSSPTSLSSLSNLSLCETLPYHQTHLSY